MPEVPATESAFHSVLAAEQSMLQAVAGSTISEAGTRSLIYLSTLSSGLVAVGFAGGSPALLATLTFTVLPTITVRRRISRIREHFASLHPLGPELIAADHPRNGELGIRYSRTSFLFTMASMIAAVNAVLGGALVALVLLTGFGAPTLPAQIVGAAVGLVLLAATLVYERRRIREATEG
jgi:hypothetical protein